MAERALVIGASGISGGGMIAELLEAGIETWGTTRYRSFGGVWEQYISRIHNAYADVMDLSSLLHVLKESNPTQIYYMAAIASIPYASVVPLITYQTNVMGWVNMLEAVRFWNGNARILCPGSCAQYGLTAKTHVPLTEESPFLPQTAYAASKCALDAIAYQYWDQWKIPIVRTRTFYLAGPGQVESYACASFAAQVARAEAGRQEVIKHGNLEAERDYMDVRDASHAYRFLLERGRAGEAYNMCSGHGTKMSWVLDTLKGMAKRPIKTEVEQARMRPAEIPTIVGSPAKLQNETGWKPRYTMEKTLADMLDYARHQLKNEE